jgi:uncharacterized phage-associated protein
MSKISAVDVANFFISLANSSPEDDITNLKVNKLVYFAQGWNLAKYDATIFGDDIQAWQYGPVEPCVYNTFKDNEYRKIEKTSNNDYLSKFTTQQIEFLIDIYKTYGIYTATALRDMTHQKGTPWAMYYNDCERNVVIPNKVIKDFFKKQPPLSSSFDFDFSKIETVGYRNSKGHYIIPREEDDDEEYE